MNSSVNSSVQLSVSEHLGLMQNLMKQLTSSMQAKKQNMQLQLLSLQRLRLLYVTQKTL